MDLTSRGSGGEEAPDLLLGRLVGQPTACQGGPGIGLNVGPLLSSCSLLGEGAFEEMENLLVQAPTVAESALPEALQKLGGEVLDSDGRHDGTKMVAQWSRN